MMDLALMTDAVAGVTQQGLGCGKLLSLRQSNFVSNNNLSLSESSVDRSSGGFFRISAMILNALAPPPVKPNRSRTNRRIRKKRRQIRRSSDGDDDARGDDSGGLFGGDSYSSFGGGGGCGDWGGGGGRGWNFDPFGRQNWDESSSWSSAFLSEFIYEVVGWIALSSCLYFAFKRVVNGGVDRLLWRQINLFGLLAR